VHLGCYTACVGAPVHRGLAAAAAAAKVNDDCKDGGTPDQLQCVKVKRECCCHTVQWSLCRRLMVRVWWTLPNDQRSAHFSPVSSMTAATGQ